MSGELNVKIHDKNIGVVSEQKHEHAFSYHHDVDASDFVSLTMPVRTKSYQFQGVHPIFEMSLPEGYLLAVIKKHFAKLTDTEGLGLLKLLAPSIKGRLQFGTENTSGADELTLSELLHPSSNTLFQELVHRFALSSPVSGVQPKVLANVVNKATLNVEQYIVKAWGEDYPELALNEFICMSILKDAGIPVPEFYLSDDQRLFVMKRFDLLDDGQCLGFEDICVLQGKSSSKKYTGSVEQVLKSIRLFVSEGHQRTATEQFFKMMVLNNLLQNGDAHLKNFGVLYTSDYDVRLAPAYDVVSTTYYIQNDIAALNMLGSKRWRGMKELLDFGVKHCEFSKKRSLELYEHCVEACVRARPKIEEHLTNTCNHDQKALLQHFLQLIDKLKITLLH